MGRKKHTINKGSFPCFTHSMNKLTVFFLIILLIFTFLANAQVKNPMPPKVADTSKKAKKARVSAMKVKAESDKHWIGNEMAKLTADDMFGRGYVNGGVDSAAKYILKRFKELRLQPLIPGRHYAQAFAFPVNTFPGKMALSVNGKFLTPGEDFLIDAGSPSLVMGDVPVKRIDFANFSDSAQWLQMLASIDEGHTYALYNADDFCEKMLHIKQDELAALLPKGCYIIPEEKKLTWTVSRDVNAATVFYVKKDALPKKIKRVSVNETAEFVPHFHNENIIGCIPGAVRDTFVAFTAHYDHLGMMGASTVFPGASDNASGVAVLLYLASFYAQHPPHYTTLFIAFAGEEAGLMGSEFYVSEPVVPLKNMKFLTNIDIMGDATDGITVVNATKYPDQFEFLKFINAQEKYVPAIFSRPPAANSDQYYFTNAGVPCFFIYSDGGPGYYHDVFDKVQMVTLDHVDDVAHLLIDFVKGL